MKSTTIMLAGLLAISTGTFAQAPQDSTKSRTTKSTGMKKSTGTKYTCAMHPEVVMDKPGKCPKCGMTLVAMKTARKSKKDRMKM